MARLSTTLALAWARRHARRFPPRPFVPLPPDTQARILVVQTTGIGDTIFCTAPIADLRESFPRAHIAAFVDRRRTALLQHNPRLNELIPYPGKYRRVFATVRELKRRAFDLAIIQHANDPDVVPLVAAAQPRWMIGYQSHTFSLLYSVKLPPADRAGGAHTLDARLALCRAAGAAGTHWGMELYPGPQDEQHASQALARTGLRGPVALNLGGSLPSKRWPRHHWHELLALLEARNQPAILLGGPEEAELARELAAAHRGCAALAGELKLMASAALVRLCSAHVSADTGLLHAGLALKVPTVALFGPDDPHWTGPYPRQERAVVLQAPAEARPAGYDRRADHTGVLMELIQPRQVLYALEQVQQDGDQSRSA